MKKRAFTLIELLVVIAIIAILAAILFPVFAQAKAAAKKTADLSNTKQLDLGAIMYAGDYDDSLGDAPAYGNAVQTFILAVRMAPYVKNNPIWKCPTSPYQMGSIQRELAYTNGIYPPNDPCVGLSNVADPNEATYYNDIYPPTDYELNPALWSYQSGGCPTGGYSGGYSHPGPNLTSGVGGLSNWTGGGITINDPAKVVLLIDGPADGSVYPGASFANGSFWGATYMGMNGSGSNAAFVDGHSKFYQEAALAPYGQTLDGGSWAANPTMFPGVIDREYSSTVAGSGTMWPVWGTSVGAPNYQ
jgi:prepilin-type N-terminal cleavage/methylation domain-containing protein/prepilin-type processing-associated H-X9-DG protein